MSTQVKNETTRKNRGSRVKSDKVSAKDLQTVKNSVAAVESGSFTSHDLAVTINTGAGSVAAVPAGRVSGVASTIQDANEIKVMDLRAKISSNWVAPEWSGAAALRASLAAIGTLSEEQINAAVSAAGRKSGEDLSVKTPTLDEIITNINNDYAKEFATVCGCACPAVGAVRLYEYTSLSLSTITANSVLSDYITASPIPAGLSASGLVSAVMSVRFLVDVKRRLAAARAAARNEFKDKMQGVARRGLALGVSAALAGRYLSMLYNTVSIQDATDAKKIERNLSSCWASLRRIENNIVLAGGRGALADGCGGWVFPAAGVAAVVPVSGVGAAKVRKLWAKRVRVLSSIDTLNGLLARC
jgi:hypothetical protein